MVALVEIDLFSLLMQSFLAADKPLSEVPLMPSHEELCICDQGMCAVDSRYFYYCKYMLEFIVE